MAPLNLDSLKLSPCSGGELRGNCPFCNDQKGRLYINKSKGVYYCHRCGTGGKIGSSDIEPSAARFDREDRKEEAGELDVEKLNRAYTVLIETLGLSGEHFKHLTEVRRLSVSQISKSYRTLPGVSRIKIAGKVATKAELAGVPGFYKRYGKWCLAGPEGILIPVRNFEGRIWGAQIRLNNPINRKYCWLSSVDTPKSRRPEGTPARAVYHVAKGNHGGNPHRVWVTEGALKGDIASGILGETFVCVPGVNSWKKSGLIRDLVLNEVTEVIICYDADILTNVNVKKAAQKLYWAMKPVGLKVAFAYWDIEKGKGIDDLLLDGHEPELISEKEWRKKVYSVQSQNRGLEKASSL